MANYRLPGAEHWGSWSHIKLIRVIRVARLGLVAELVRAIIRAIY